MIQLWKREWIYWKNKWLLQTGVGILVPLLLLLIYKVGSSGMLALAEGIFRLPPEVYRLFGFGENAQTGTFLFYLFFACIFLNMWFLWQNCQRAMESVYREEWDEGIYLLCNQFYSRGQLGLMKYLWSLASFFASHAICYLFYMLYAVLGSGSAQQRGADVKAVFLLFLIGSAVQCFFLSASFFMAVHRTRRGDCTFGGGLDLAVFGSLALGNLYKVRNLLAMVFLNRNEKLHQLFVADGVFRWLDFLYWISPLSWMNPFTMQSGGRFAMQILLLLALSGLFAILGIWDYGPQGKE